MKGSDSVIFGIQSQIFGTSGVMNVVIRKIRVIPPDAVTNQNAVDFILWNGVIPLDVDCGGACVVVSDKRRANRGHCVATRQVVC